MKAEEVHPFSIAFWNLVDVCIAGGLQTIVQSVDVALHPPSNAP